MKYKISLLCAWVILTLGIGLSGCEDPLVCLGSTIAGSDAASTHETVVDNDGSIHNPHAGQDSEDNDDDDDDAQLTGRSNSESRVSVDSDDDDIYGKGDICNSERDSESNED